MLVNMTFQLVETTSTITKSGNRYMVVIAAPGKGNSGTYLREVLMQDGPLAVPKGTKSWIGHAKPEDRDPRDLLGKFEGAYYDDNYDKVKYPEGALVSPISIRQSHLAMIEELGEDAEFSLYMDGDKDADGIVTAMYPGRANSVDLVAYGGIEGAGLREKLEESFRLSETHSEDESGRTSAQKKKEGNVDFEEKVTAALEALTARLDTLANGASAEAIAKAETEAKAAAEAEAGAKVDDVLAKYDEQIKAIDAAELIPSQVESLKASARKGEDVAPLIESFEKQNEEIKTHLTESLGSVVGGVRLSESATGKNEDFSVGGW